MADLKILAQSFISFCSLGTISEKMATRRTREKLFNSNDILAVRYEYGGFYLCISNQAIFVASEKVKIRWLEEVKDDVYKKSYNDTIAKDSIIRTVALVPYQKQYFELDKNEKAAILLELELEKTDQNEEEEIESHSIVDEKEEKEEIESHSIVVEKEKTDQNEEEEIESHYIVDEKEEEEGIESHSIVDENEEEEGIESHSIVDEKEEEEGIESHSIVDEKDETDQNKEEEIESHYIVDEKEEEEEIESHSIVDENEEEEGIESHSIVDEKEEEEGIESHSIVDEKDETDQNKEEEIESHSIVDEKEEEEGIESHSIVDEKEEKEEIKSHCIVEENEETDQNEEEEIESHSIVVEKEKTDQIEEEEIENDFMSSALSPTRSILSQSLIDDSEDSVIISPIKSYPNLHKFVIGSDRNEAVIETEIKIDKQKNKEINETNIEIDRDSSGYEKGKTDKNKDGGNKVIAQAQKQITKPKQTKINQTKEQEDIESDSSGDEKGKTDKGAETNESSTHPALYVKCSNNTETKRVFDKKHFCLYCQIGSTNLSKHLLGRHSDEEYVKQIAQSQKKSKDRSFLLEKVRNLGDFLHNTKVLEDGSGELIPWRSPSIPTLADQYLPCSHCFAFFDKAMLWRHNKNCEFRLAEGCNRLSFKKVSAESSLLLPTQCEISSGLRTHVIGKMNQDEITIAARNDPTIIAYGSKLFQRLGHLEHLHTHISTKMRELSRLLMILRQLNPGGLWLADFLKPDQFSIVLKAVRKLCGLNEDNNEFKTPSLALKLGHAIRKCAIIITGQSIKDCNDELRKSSMDFTFLCDKEWTEEVSSCALNTLRMAKANKSQILPLTEDIMKLQHYLEEESNRLTRLLSNDVSPKNWLSLAKVTLARTILFNRKRGGEAERFLVSSYLGRNTNVLTCKDVADSLTDLERILCQRMTRVEVRGKRGRIVPIILTPELTNSIDLLLAKRSDVKISPNNPFLFARTSPECNTCLTGHKCLKEAAINSGALHPNKLTSTRLRKHMATVSQILNLKESELDQLATFLGHSISVHRNFYRLPEDTLQLAKVSKILLALEKGNISDFQGKNLDEINLETLVSDNESDTEDEDDSKTSDVDDIETGSEVKKTAEAKHKTSKTAHEKTLHMNRNRKRSYKSTNKLGVEELESEVRAGSEMEEREETEHKKSKTTHEKALHMNRNRKRSYKSTNKLGVEELESEVRAGSEMEEREETEHKKSKTTHEKTLHMNRNRKRSYKSTNKLGVEELESEVRAGSEMEEREETEHKKSKTTHEKKLHINRTRKRSCKSTNKLIVEELESEVRAGSEMEETTETKHRKNRNLNRKTSCTSSTNSCSDDQNSNIEADKKCDSDKESDGDESKHAKDEHSKICYFLGYIVILLLAVDMCKCVRNHYHHRLNGHMK